MQEKHGVLVSVDGGAYTDEADFVIGNSDILIISEEFYSAVFSDDSYMENCRKLTEQGPQIVIVTLGAKGLRRCKTGGAAFQLPPFEGHKIVDTTGAGDVFTVDSSMPTVRAGNWNTVQSLQAPSPISTVPALEEEWAYRIGRW